MTSAERRKAAVERHRAFLENVTGRVFHAPTFDAISGGVRFASLGWVSTGDRHGLLRLDSLITDVKDFAS